MRISGGKYKSRRIKVSRAFRSRPTTDYAKEGLFNILSNHFNLSEIRFLDLFTGTGSIGLEMASRGCTNAELVDENRALVHHLKEILNELGAEGIRPVHSEVFTYIRICKKLYDIIFADPPYDMKSLKELPDAVLGKEILLPGGWFILEHPGTYDFSGHPSFFDSRRYGDVHFSFFKQKDAGILPA